MLADLAVVCERCDAPLREDHRRFSMTSPDGVRHAYECDCGAVTITVAEAATN
ncbi:MAG: hypothetical protein ABEJ67_03670 [Halanaeroarchaeum sp.]